MTRHATRLARGRTILGLVGTFLLCVAQSSLRGQSGGSHVPDLVTVLSGNSPRGAGGESTRSKGRMDGGWQDAGASRDWRDPRIEVKDDPDAPGATEKEIEDIERQLERDRKRPDLTREEPADDSEPYDPKDHYGLPEKKGGGEVEAEVPNETPNPDPEEGAQGAGEENQDRSRSRSANLQDESGKARIPASQQPSPLRPE